MLPKTGNIYIISAISIIGGGLFGFDVSSMSAIIATQQYLCYFQQGPKAADGKCTGPSSSVQGGITASMSAGSWLGALLSGFISDRLGRKSAIQIASVLWIIGCIIVCASQDIAMLVVGRIVNGLCVGIASAQVPVYISELAPPLKRGRLVGAQQWAVTIGIFLMFYICYGCSYIQGTAAFRVPWMLQAIPAILLFIGMLFLPESPRWLASKDRWEECRDVLVLTHGHGDLESPFVQHEFDEIKQWCQIEAEAKNISYLELLSPRMINRLHIGLFTQIWSQLTGMNVMSKCILSNLELGMRMYYITYVFSMAGLTGNTLLISSSIQYVINVVMTVPALIWVDRWGRRPVLMIGSTLMATWLFANAGILAVYGKYPGPDGVDGIKEASIEVSGAASKAVIACSFLFVASYAPTWGPVSWIYPSEIFPNRVRGRAVALATSANWAFNFALAYFVPPAFVNITWKVYIVFAVFCVAMTIHVFFMFPETAGRPLEEITDLFEDPSGIRYIGTPAWKTKGQYNVSTRMEHGDVDLEKKIGRDEVPEMHEVVPKDVAA